MDILPLKSAVAVAAGEEAEDDKKKKKSKRGGKGGRDGGVREGDKRVRSGGGGTIHQHGRNASRQQSGSDPNGKAVDVVVDGAAVHDHDVVHAGAR